MYLLDHLLDELVGGFEVLGVRAVQQAGQHLAKRKNTQWVIIKLAGLHGSRLVQRQAERSHFRLFLVFEYGVLGSGRREVQQFVRRQLRVLFDNS